MNSSICADLKDHLKENTEFLRVNSTLLADARSHFERIHRDSGVEHATLLNELLEAHQAKKNDPRKS